MSICVPIYRDIGQPFITKQVAFGLKFHPLIVSNLYDIGASFAPIKLA